MGGGSESVSAQRGNVHVAQYASVYAHPNEHATSAQNSHGD